MANLPVPSPRTFGVSEVEVASYLNSIRDALTFLLNPPIALVFQTTVQSVNNVATNAISMDTTLVDTYGGHSNTTNSSRYTAVVAGWYWVEGVVGWAPNSTGNRAALLDKNGTTIAQGETFQFSATNNNAATVSASTAVFLNPGEYVEVQGYQASGGALNTQTMLSSLFVLWTHA